MVTMEQAYEIETKQRQKFQIQWGNKPPAWFEEVDYNDAAHKYSCRDKIYVSATQLIEKFHKKFDKKEEAQLYADKYGHTAEYWLNKWDTITQTSLRRGNKIHNEKQEFLYGRGFDRIHGKDFLVQNLNLFPGHNYYQLPDGCYPELKLWRHD